MRNYRNWLDFTVPLGFTALTRAKKINGWLRFTLKYLVPCLIIIMTFGNFSLRRCVFGIAFVYGIYELGYIHNDCETIKKETKPTLRLDSGDFSFYENNKVSIFFIRIAILFLLGCYLWFVAKVSTGILLLSLIIIPIFYVYNVIRSRWNLEIHIFLMLLRYYCFIAIVMNVLRWDIVLLVLFLYPVEVYIELSVKGKFGYENKFFQKYMMSDFGQIHLFRVKYYFIFAVGLFLLGLILKFSYYYCLPYLYFFFYSLIVYFQRKISFK